MTPKISRRRMLELGAVSFGVLSARGGAAAPSPTDTELVAEAVRLNDENMRRALQTQVTEAGSRWHGAFPDSHGIHHGHAAAGFLKNAAAAYFHPRSAHHAGGGLLEAMTLAAGFLERVQNEEGNIDLLSTNFNSPPDTAFAVHSVACAAQLARMHDDKAVFQLLENFLQKAGRALSHGGIHTPNHRWVVCAALAQINALFPGRRLVRRIDQWLAEGIDLDAEGQFIERSTAGYNAVVDHALTVTALKLGRPELLDPVRKNLDAMAYLLHPNGEVVTEISRRQDLNTRGTMAGYWFALRTLAIRDGNGLYASMLRFLEPRHADLAQLMEYPELQGRLPEATPIPDDYEREYPLSGMTRVRRGKTSLTLLHTGNSRFLTLRRGEAAIGALRFATAFFGKGQFIPGSFEKQGGVYCFRQEIQGRYLQPVDDPGLLPVTPENWIKASGRREQTQRCRMVYEATVRETATGLEISLSAQGTDNVPLAVEINFLEGGELTGVVPVAGSNSAFLLKEGFGEYRMGGDVLRFGPGHAEHQWVQLRGAEPALPGTSVYLTGYTPFQHVLTLRMD